MNLSKQKKKVDLKKNINNITYGSCIMVNGMWTDSELDYERGIEVYHRQNIHHSDTAWVKVHEHQVCLQSNK